MALTRLFQAEKQGITPNGRVALIIHYPVFYASCVLDFVNLGKIMYKDKEKQKAAKREWARKHRHSVEPLPVEPLKVEPSVTPCVEPDKSYRNNKNIFERPDGSLYLVDVTGQIHEWHRPEDTVEFKILKGWYRGEGTEHQYGLSSLYQFYFGGLKG